MNTEFNQVKFSDSDVVNPEDYIPKSQYNPHNVRPFLFHDHGFVLAVVFADCLQDALDIAVDKNKLDQFKIAEADLSDYEDSGDISYLGNAGEPFDIESIQMIELPNPAFSFCALLRNEMESEQI